MFPKTIKVIFLIYKIFSLHFSVPLQSFSPDPDDSTENCGGENGAPLMTPCKSSIILEAQTSSTLKCEGEDPMVWWTSSVDHLQGIAGDRFDNTEDPARPYGTSLTLYEVTADDVGAYYCVKDSEFNKISEKSDEAMVELVNQGLASSIYVYVNDPVSKLAPAISSINALQYTDVVIPCRPAMPDTEVWLETNNGEVSGRDVKPTFIHRRIILGGSILLLLYVQKFLDFFWMDLSSKFLLVSRIMISSSIFKKCI